MIAEALTIALCFAEIGSPCAPCETPWGTHEGVVCLSPQFVEFIEQVAPCESYYTKDRFWPDGTIKHPGQEVGDHGQSKGTMQINAPSWRAKMEQWGLIYENERDRLRFGQWLWANVGPGQWSCSA